MISIGDFVVVTGCSQKGKNRIREHGAVWEIIKISGTNRFLVESTDGANNLRWVDIPSDVDFRVVKIVNPNTL